jgi:hypothetical protein
MSVLEPLPLTTANLRVLLALLAVEAGGGVVYRGVGR